MRRLYAITFDPVLPTRDLATYLHENIPADIIEAMNLKQQVLESVPGGPARALRRLAVDARQDLSADRQVVRGHAPKDAREQWAKVAAGGLAPTSSRLAGDEALGRPWGRHTRVFNQRAAPRRFGRGWRRSTPGLRQRVHLRLDRESARPGRAQHRPVSPEFRHMWTFVVLLDDGVARLVSRDRFRLPMLAAHMGMLPMEPAPLLIERRIPLGSKRPAERLAAHPKLVGRDKDERGAPV